MSLINRLKEISRKHASRPLGLSMPVVYLGMYLGGYLGVCFGALLIANQASAHARFSLTGQFIPRSTNSGIVMGPCGTDAHLATPAVVKPGSTVTVKWEETIHHTGRFQLFFSTGANDANLSMGATAGTVKLFDVAQSFADANVPHEYSQTVTLPSAECAACSMQLVQVNTDVTPTVYYFSCSDVVLSNAAVGPTPTPTPMPSPSATPATSTTVDCATGTTVAPTATPSQTAATPTPTPTPMPTATPIPVAATFANVNSMIIQPKCASCHSGATPPMGYSFTTYAGVFTAVNVTTPTSSLLYSVTVDAAMPPGGPALTAGQESLILRWIQAGAPNN